MKELAGGPQPTDRDVDTIRAGEPDASTRSTPKEGNRDQSDSGPVVFITYRRSDGGRASAWLLDRLVCYRLPAEVCRMLEARGRTARPLSVLRDIEQRRATADFDKEILRPALQASQFLVVVATPDLARARETGGTDWARYEIESFLSCHSADRVLIATTVGGGNPPLPPDLRDCFPRAQVLDLRGLTFWRFIWWRRLASLRDEVLSAVVKLYDLSSGEIAILRRLEARVRRRTRGFLCLAAALLTVAFVVGINSIRQAGSRAAAARAAEQSSRHATQSLQLADQDPQLALRLAYEASLLHRSGLTDEALRRALDALGASPATWTAPVRWVDAHSMPVDSGWRLTVAGEKVPLMPLLRLRGDSGPELALSPTGDRLLLREEAGAAASLLATDHLELTGVASLAELVQRAELVATLALQDEDIHLATFSKVAPYAVTQHSGSEDIVYWDAFSGERLGRPARSIDPVVALSFAGNCTFTLGQIATSGTLHVVQAEWSKTLYPADSRQVTCASFSVSGTTLAVGCADGTVCIWSVADRQEVEVLRCGEAPILSLAYAPDGSRIAASNAVGTVHLWSVSSTGSGCERAGTLHRAGAKLAGVRWRADGGRVIAIDEGNYTVVVWEVDDPEPVSVLPHPEPVCSAAFVPGKGAILTLSTSDDTESATVRIWPEDALKVTERLGPRGLTLTELETYGIGSNDERRRIRELLEANPTQQRLIEAIRGDRVLSARARRWAVQASRARPEDLETLFLAAWNIVKSPKCAESDYELARALLEACRAANPQDDLYRATLALAHIRLGGYDRAQQLLPASSHSAPPTPTIVTDLMYGALADYEIALALRSTKAKDEAVARAKQGLAAIGGLTLQITSEIDHRAYNQDLASIFEEIALRVIGPNWAEWKVAAPARVEVDLNADLTYERSGVTIQMPEGLQLSADLVPKTPEEITLEGVMSEAVKRALARKAEGDQGGALEELQRAEDAARELADGSSTDERLASLGVILGMKAGTFGTLGRLDEAEASSQDAVERFKELTARSRKPVYWTALLLHLVQRAATRHGEDRVHAISADLESIAAVLSDGIQARRELDVDDWIANVVGRESALSYEEFISSALYELSQQLLADGSIRDAQHAAALSLAVHRGLVEKYGNPSLRFKAEQVRRYYESLQNSDARVPCVNGLSELLPADSVSDEIRSLFQQAGKDERDGRTALAIERYGQALLAVEDALKGAPHRIEILAAKAVLLDNRAGALLDLGEVDLSQAASDEALTILGELVIEGHVEFECLLAYARLNRAKFELDRGRVDEALVNYGQFCEIYRHRRVYLSPTVPLRIQVAVSLCNFLEAQRQGAELSAAITSLDSLLAILVDLVELDGLEQYRPQLAAGYFERGRLHHRSGHLEGALDDMIASAKVYSLVESPIANPHPLHYAVSVDLPAWVEEILKVASVSVESSGREALHVAAAENRADCAKLLLAAGADPDARDAGGDTPLHLAARWGHVSMIELLVAHDADIEAINEQGWTPLKTAQAFGQIEAVEKLRAQEK